MPYISVPAEDVEQPQQGDATLTPGDYTGEPRTFAAWQKLDEEGKTLKAGIVTSFYALQNGGSAPVAGRKSYFITTEHATNAKVVEIGCRQLARLGAALGVTETDDDGNVFIPGETLDEIVSTLELGTPPGTRLGFRVQDRMWLNADKTPQIDAQTGEPRVSNEVKSVWALRS